MFSNQNYIEGKRMTTELPRSINTNLAEIKKLFTQNTLWFH